MQAYATAEMPPAGELRVLDRRLATSDGIGEVTAAGNGGLDELLGQLADLVAAKVDARRLSRTQTTGGTDRPDAQVT